MRNLVRLSLRLRAAVSFLSYCLVILRLAATWLVLGLVASSSASAAIELRIDELTVEGGHVRFRIGSCNVESGLNAESRQEMPQDETAKYLVYVDLAKSSRTNFGYFVYKFFVQAKSLTPGGSQVCTYSVQAFSAGSFIDQVAEVPYRVGEANQTEEGTIRIPIHSASYSKAIIESRPSEALSKVSLSSETPILLSLVNELSDLPLEITGDVRVFTESPQNWKKNGQAPRATLQLPGPQRNILRAGQKLDIGIRLALNPDPWRALGASIFPLEPGKPHETIHLSLDYRTPGGTPATLDIPVPIRFSPSFWSLLIVVLIGSALASTAGGLLPKSEGKGPVRWYIGLAAGLLGGILAEALGMILVSSNSKFRLLGFELDPYQILPAFLIGALIGLVGFRRAADFLDLFRKQVP